MLGITLGATSNLNQTLINSILGNNAILTGDAGVNGIIGLDSDNYAVPDTYLKDATPETVIGTGGIPDDIPT
jgi:hypothetical protein